jgi:hypothetical protein
MENRKKNTPSQQAKTGTSSRKSKTTKWSKKAASNKATLAVAAELTDQVAKLEAALPPEKEGSPEAARRPSPLDGLYGVDCVSAMPVEVRKRLESAINYHNTLEAPCCYFARLDDGRYSPFVMLQESRGSTWELIGCVVYSPGLR